MTSEQEDRIHRKIKGALNAVFKAHGSKVLRIEYLGSISKRIIGQLKSEELIPDENMERERLLNLIINWEEKLRSRRKATRFLKGESLTNLKTKNKLMGKMISELRKTLRMEERPRSKIQSLETVL